MNWVLYTFTAVLFLAFYYYGKRHGQSRERARIISYGYDFQRRQSKISPTLNDFLSSVENSEHRK